VLSAVRLYTAEGEMEFEVQVNGYAWIEEDLNHDK
jgi:hypothetical protein